MLTNAELKTLAAVVRFASEHYDLKDARQQEEVAHLVQRYGYDRIGEVARAQAVCFPSADCEHGYSEDDHVEDTVSAVFCCLDG